MSQTVKLHIGGTEVKEGWKILNIMDAPGVDIVGSCTDLSMFADDSVDEVYASHILEHLAASQAAVATKEICRVLKPGGALKGSVPDMTTLCRLYVDHSTDTALQIKIMHMIYGGHMNEFDIHHFGYNFQIMAAIVAQAGFSRIDQVEFFHEFEDTSILKYEDVPISLNFIAIK